MKFLPASFRETQRDWFGKKGKSWHVSVVIMKRNEAEENEVIYCVSKIMRNFYQAATLGALTVGCLIEVDCL